MLIPRFSLRWLLTVTTVCGVLALIFSQAVNGSAWAVGFCWALAALTVNFLLFVAVFLVAWGGLQLIVMRRAKRTASPFATNTPPPQILAPPDPP